MVNGMLARVVPQSMWSVAPAGVSLDRDSQLLGGFRRLAERHRRAAEVVALRIGDAPLAGLLAEHELPGPARGNGVDRVGAGGHVRLPNISILSVLRVVASSAPVRHSLPS